MALKITEVNGKLVLEGNINSVTSRFLDQHIQVMKNSGMIHGNHQGLNENIIMNSGF